MHKIAKTLFIGLSVIGSASAVYLLYLKFRHKFNATTNNVNLQLRHKKYKEIGDQMKVVEISSLKEFKLHWNNFVSACQPFRFCGLDCEWWWRNDIGETGTVALLQLAIPFGEVLLIRLHHLDEIPNELEDFIKNKGILKFGVGIDGDARKLFDDLGLVTNGFVDIRFLVHRVYGSNFHSYGLKSLSKNLLGISYFDLETQARTNWEADQLTEDQIKYAALDALVGSLIPIEIICKKYDIDFDAALDTSKTIAYLRPLCQGVIDVVFKSRSLPTTLPLMSVTSLRTEACSTNEKEHRFSAVRQNPLYHNCRMLAPNNDLLCTMNRKKADWYISRNLAVFVQESPYTIKLNFDPERRSDPDESYYVEEKDNQCVVCGNTDALVRKNVIPQEYRKHFPGLLKSHKSHDIVPMCPNCHVESDRFSSLKKDLLAVEYSAPIGHERAVTSSSFQGIKELKSAANALLRQRQGLVRIPAQRVADLEKVVKDFHSVEEITDQLLADSIAVMSSEDKDVKTGFIRHGERVVTQVLDAGEILEFERMWRQYFLDTMKPQFLPSSWSVTHRHKSLRRQMDELQTDPTSSNTMTELLV